MTPEEEQRYMAMLMREQQEQPAQGGGPPPGAMQAGMKMSGGGGGGGGGGAGMGAAAWPAALAAVIAANETYQNKEGNRPAQFKNQAKEMFTGEALERDANKYLEDVPGAQFLAEMGNPKGIAENVGKALQPWEWF